MKAKILTSAILLCGSLISLPSSSDFSGDWEGTLIGPDEKPIELSFTFKVEGEKLTGAIQSPLGELNIDEGKTDGKAFKFAVAVQGTTLKTEGKYYPVADSIGLDVDVAGTKIHSRLLRAK